MPSSKPEPGRDPQMAERTNRLNVVFAGSSIGLLIVLSLMVLADYNREWKKYQIQFDKMEVKLTEEQIQGALGKVGADRLKALDSELKKGDAEVASKKADVERAEALGRKVHDEWYGIDQKYRFQKADIDVERYGYEEAAHNKDSSAARKQQELRNSEKALEGLRLQLEDVKGREAAATAHLHELEKTKLDAEAKQKDLLGETSRLREKLAKIEPGFVSFVRNLPILDLANPSLKVNQIMPANLYDDVIFTQTPKVDRCTTCHVGIDKKGYENAQQPYTTHPNMEVYLRGAHPIERIGCTVCHLGRGRATGFREAVHTPGDAAQEEAWGKYTRTKAYERWHQWDYPMLARGTTESQCAKCHQGSVEVPKAERLNTGIFLIERYGCFGCHKIKGWENLRKVGPDLTRITSKTNPEWIFRWVKEPKAFRPTRMPQIWDVRYGETAEQKSRNDVEVNSVVTYVSEKSGSVTYPTPPSGSAEKGQKLVETVGCLGCHRIGDEDKRGITGIPATAFRTHGPNLEGTGSKVNAGWLYAWIRNPKSYWHETKMPNLRLTETEASDITAYLMGLKNPEFLARSRPPMDAPLRDKIALEYLLAQYTVAEADQKLKAMDDHARTLFLGEKTIGRYGCFGCHNIPGFEKTAPVGVELTEEGSKLVERLDFGFEEGSPKEGKIAHTLPAWLHRKLMEPRIFDRDKIKKPDELLRMPKFHFVDEEADAIVTAVSSFTKEQVPLAAQKQLSADERYVEAGRRLVRNLNCQACHVIGGKGGTIRAVVESQLEASGADTLQAQALSPPILYNEKSKIGEGARVKTAWLHGFLSDPSNHVRPWLQIRMPTFEFTEEEINTITRYFAAQDGVAYPYEPALSTDGQLASVGKDLFAKWQCVKCHVVAGKLPNQEPANMAPDLANVPNRIRAAWLPLWLADPGKIMPGTRMPANFPENPEDNAYREILGGDQKKQIEAVRAYLLTLGRNGPSAPPADH